MIVVSDTTTITNLIHIDKLLLLRELYVEVIIPKEVYDELCKLSNQKLEIDAHDWILVESISDFSVYEEIIEELDKGEAEAISLALERNADLLIIDESAGRKIAQSYGLRIIGLLGVLIASKQRGLIPLLKPSLEKLISEFGFRIHPNLVSRVLGQVGE